MNPIFKQLLKPFHKTATDADLGRPDRRLSLTKHESITVCNECEEQIQYLSAGDETWRYCENCHLTEGDTFTIEGADDCDCSFGDDGISPSVCRQCRVRKEMGL